MKYKIIIIDFVSLILLLFFFYSGLVKLVKLELFGSWVSGVPLLRLSPKIFKYIVPLVEILISFLFLFNKFRKQAMYISLWALVLYTGYIVSIFLLKLKFRNPFQGISRLRSWIDEAYTSIILSGLLVIAILVLENISTKSKELNRNHQL